MTDYKSMFEQAVRTLAAIDEALGIGDDGCGDPDQTLTAIAELKAAKVGAGRTATVTREEIIALARQCGLWSEYAGPIDRIEAFFHAAQRLEREGIADDLEHGFVDDEGHHIQYAEAIRNRGAS